MYSDFSVLVNWSERSFDFSKTGRSAVSKDRFICAHNLEWVLKLPIDLNGKANLKDSSMVHYASYSLILG
jgi:hypothetical protein